ncbi:hypothetical protein [Curtobacterium sp. UNCCL17]|uniref:hypothetical protein n=1 Tax=Curtobacterium sp. UNCCL17 TaxID=1449051 RepID=UPI000481B2B7|nr:hypothetical protein [Curtobacterium sp. UNCCL17]
MNINLKTISAGFAGAAVLGLAAFGVVQLSPVGAAQADDAAGTLSPANASAISPIYGSAQTSGDKLPAFLLDGPQAIDGIVPESTHLLGIDAGTKAWAALDTDGQACLISLLPGSEQWASATCATPEKFAEQGIGLQAATETEASRLYFVPAGYGTADGLEPVGAQLLTANPHVTDAEAPELQKVASTKSRTLSAASGPSTVKLLPFIAVEDLRE